MNSASQKLEHVGRQLARHPWLPKELLHLALEVTRLQDATSVSPLKMPQEVASSHAHAQGQPLLTPELFPYDAAGAAALWEALLTLAQSMPAPLGASASAVRDSMARTEAPLLIQDAFTALLHGDQDFFALWEKALPEAPAMPRFLATAALTPWLAAASSALAPWHKAESVWEYGQCPHCGHLPLMGQLRGKEGFRWHVCSFCRLEYRVPRLQCPVCLEKDAAKLRYFTAAEQEGYEVHVCESCKNYIKLRNMREMESNAPYPALDDLDSLPLDLAARQQGYVRSTLSAWGF